MDLLLQLLQDLGLLHRQVLHLQEPMLVAELELPVAHLLFPIPLLDLQRDLQGGHQGFYNLIPEDSLGH